MTQPDAHQSDATKTAPIMTAQDVRAFRTDFYVQLPEVSDAALIEALAGHDEVVFLARQWGWADTEVREAAAAVLDKAQGLDLP